MQPLGRARSCFAKLPLETLTCQRPLSTSSKAASLATTTSSYHAPASIPLPLENASDTSLSRIPTSSLIRSFCLSRLFASPWAIRPGLAVMQIIASSRSKFLDPDRNPALKMLIKPTVYDHFCAGVDEKEVRQTSTAIRQLGFSGISLCFAREIQLGEDKSMLGYDQASADLAEEEIKQWRDGLLQTLQMTRSGDWMAIKITGAGSNVMNNLMNDEELPTSFHEAMDAICAQAHEQNTRIVIDSEQQAVQKGIDTIAINLMRTWNKSRSKPLVYNTLQAYLKSAPTKLKHQLNLANTENWNLGLKLVRGAYIAIDQRSLIHDTKADTDASYNGIVRDLLQGTVPGVQADEYPNFELLLAGHNKESVMAACELATKLCEQGQLKVHPEFAQLQGMADDLAFEVLADAEAKQPTDKDQFVPRVYKYLSWGTVRECMQYLVRRAVENQDAAARMKDGAAKYGKEIRRRMKASIGLGSA